MKTALIIGAGPAGLTAALEFLEKTDIKPIVLEASGDLGGIAKTIVYHGNRIDIGGHRFFSKSDRVMEWWKRILPLQGAPAGEKGNVDVSYHHASRAIELSPEGPDPDKTDAVMLVRGRLSRIYYLRKFFKYPISLNLETVRNLGPVRMARIGASYLKARLFPIRKERSLEDFIINRFGRELYLTFFKDYTEKVWGVPCDRISPEWGAQRIKGLSISAVILHMLKRLFSRRGDVAQKDVETSLIERFLYPKLGPGQMWEEVAKRVKERGGEIRMHHEVVGLIRDGERIIAAKVRDPQGKIEPLAADWFLSTMPIRELVAGMDPPAPPEVREVAAGLQYRDFVTVGLLVRKMAIGERGLVPDNWIYVQERDVKVGRLQIFNNWSPYLVKDPNTVWLGLEYFCNEGDELWSKPDKDFVPFAAAELAKIGIIDAKDVLDGTVLRQPKAYPAYFGSYARFEVVRRWLDGIPNLFLIGRNGMHRYNNQDHSMLTAMEAVEHIAAGRTDKADIWAVNTEEEYHESK